MIRKVFDITDLKCDLPEEVTTTDDEDSDYLDTPSDKFNRNINQKVNFGGN